MSRKDKERSHAGQHQEVVGPRHDVGEIEREVLDLPAQRPDRLDATVPVGGLMIFMLPSHLVTITPPPSNGPRSAGQLLDDSRSRTGRLDPPAIAGRWSETTSLEGAPP